MLWPPTQDVETTIRFGACHLTHIAIKNHRSRCTRECHVCDRVISPVTVWFVVGSGATRWNTGDDIGRIRAPKLQQTCRGSTGTERHPYENVLILTDSMPWSGKQQINVSFRRDLTQQNPLQDQGDEGEAKTVARNRGGIVELVYLPRIAATLT